jgi:hypothetical protein
LDKRFASDDVADFVVDNIDVVESLDLEADPSKVLWAKRATVQEFHWHVSPTR